MRRRNWNRRSLKATRSIVSELLLARDKPDTGTKYQRTRLASGSSVGLLRGIPSRRPSHSRAPILSGARFRHSVLFLQMSGVIDSPVYKNVRSMRVGSQVTVVVVLSALLVGGCLPSGRRHLLRGNIQPVHVPDQGRLLPIYLSDSLAYDSTLTSLPECPIEDFGNPYDRLPVPIRIVEPLYPPDNDRERRQDIVIWVMAYVDTTGAVSWARILKSNFRPANQAVLHAAMQYTFTPAVLHGTSVPNCCALPFMKLPD